MSVNYYDDYGFPGMSAMVSDVQGQDVAINVKGLSTGGWVRVLSKSSVIFEKSTVLYDEKGRVIRAYKTNYQGGFHQTDVLLDFFTGKLIESETTHRYNANATPVTVLEKFTYSPQDRLLTLTHQINQGVEEMIQNNEYDALGQLINKRIGGPVSVSTDGYQKIDYRYNIRGWLTDINNFRNLQDSPGLYPDLFAFHINYERVYDIQGDYTGIVEGLYNGNISETYWLSSTDNTLRKYGYRYDKLNRLKDAYFQQPFSMDHNCQSYNEHLSYDKNGNILTLNRHSRLENFPAAVEIDDLEYFYQGNQLIKVTDHSSYPQGFKDDPEGVNAVIDDYRYDLFGNMYKDENKQIVFISYNHLNLPVEIQFQNGSIISYLYNAAGQKLRKIVHDAASSSSAFSTTEYLDGFQYNNSKLQFFSHPEGYVLNTPDSQGNPSYDYIYQYKDHLGNIRMNYGFFQMEFSLLTELKIYEENHYYPFGLKHENYNTEKKKIKWEPISVVGLAPIEEKRVRQTNNSGYQYKYNSKEWQDELNLNVYDFHARNYMPDIGRTSTQDPHAENYYNLSSYIFLNNNPLLYIDPDGKDIYMYFHVKGNNKTEDDDMFLSAAMTRALDFINNDNYTDKDIMVIKAVDDLGEIKDKVEGIVEKYSEKFGKTKEFGIWSHASFDGPRGSVNTSNYPLSILDPKQMSLEGWGNINFNWASNASAYFFGCRTGLDPSGENKSFNANISSLENFKNVSVYGQVDYSYPSQFPNSRRPSNNQLKGVYGSEPTYLVGGNRFTRPWINWFDNTHFEAHKMSGYKNGKKIKSKFQ